MKILDNYIARTVIGSTLMVVLILLGVESFVQFIGELDDIGKGQYGIFHALMYVPMTLPSDLYQLFPMAGLLGSLLGLGRLASSNQLVVMRASGVSKAKITWAVVRAAFVMMVFVTLAGELLAPPLYAYADRFKAVAEGNDTGLSALQHVWIRQKNRFIHIGKVIDKRHIESITQYRFKPNHRLEQVITAKSAVFDKGVWQLGSSRMTRLGKNRISTTSQKGYQLKLNFDPRLIQMSQQEPMKTSAIKLFETIRYRYGYGLNSDEYSFAFWQRIIQPVTTLVMIFLGVPFIFGSLRNVTMGFRITMGILIGFGFYMLNQLFGPISMVYQFPPWLAAILPTIMFALAGWALMRKSI